MFSRNRFNGQHGSGVAPKGGTKTKVHPPKKRAPNPRVALVIRGKIHRLLQGSVDHHVPDSHLYYAGIEEGETQEGRKEPRSVYPKVGSRTETYSPKVSSGKGGAAGPPCVGEVELNREGCIRIPCTLQHKSCRSPANVKRISFESGIRASPEHVRSLTHYGPMGLDMNGTKFAASTRSEFASPRIRPKRPFSTGDCVDCNFGRGVPGPLLEEDEDQEEASSAIIEHILKELRGINKIQEEISDLRDYLTSVRGSVEEVSSCVDAVLLEIEGIRSSNKAGSGVQAGTWSGTGCTDGPPPRRRPASAYGSLGSAMPKSKSKHHSVHGDLLLPRGEESAVSPIAESVDAQDLEEPEDASDHSSDIPVGAIAGKLSFGYLERQDDPDCPSTSSLSSGHSSKSESDLERLSSSHGGKSQMADEERWANTGPPLSAAGKAVWRRESAYLRDGCLEKHEGDGILCCEGAASWGHCSGAEYAPSGQGPTGSSEQVSARSGKHYNSPASTSSREDWQSQTRRPHLQSGSHGPSDTQHENTGDFECTADFSYPQSSGYHSIDGPDKEEDFDLSYTADCQVGSYPVSHLSYEKSSAATWPDMSSFTTAADVDAPLLLEAGASSQSSDNRLPLSASAEMHAGGFTVRRISRAVLDFSSALRGALRKLEVPAAPCPGEEADSDVPSDRPADALPSAPSSYEPQQTSGKSPKGDSSDAAVELSKSHRFSVDRVLEETNDSLTSKLENTCRHPPCSDKVPSCPEGLSICLHQGPADGSAVSQCTTGESLSTSLSVDGTVVREQSQVQQEVEGARVEPPVDISQMDERRLKCLRSFQQILREKRESRRNLSSITSSLSQDDWEPGSHSL